MKKILLLSIALIACAGVFASEAEKSISGAKPEIKTALGKDKELVNLYTITLPYSADDIKNALHARLKAEGIKGKKGKNNFYAFKEVQYTHLWDKTCDIYVGITGNKETASVNLIISLGYENYVDPHKDKETTKKAYKWLIAVDKVVYDYMHEKMLATHMKEQEDIEKELSKLEANRNKIESKIKKVENKQHKLEASKTVVKEDDLNVDSKKIAKEQKDAIALQNELTSLQSELSAVNNKIKETKGDLNKKKAVIAEFKKNKIK